MSYLYLYLYLSLHVYIHVCARACIPKPHLDGRMSRGARRADTDVCFRSHARNLVWIQLSEDCVLPPPSRTIEVSVWRSLQSQEMSMESGTGVCETNRSVKNRIRSKPPRPPTSRLGEHLRGAGPSCEKHGETSVYKSTLKQGESGGQLSCVAVMRRRLLFSQTPESTSACFQHGHLCVYHGGISLTVACCARHAGLCLSLRCLKTASFQAGAER